MLKKTVKGAVAIPLYIILALEGCFGGFGTPKPRDQWGSVVKWIRK